MEFYVPEGIINTLGEFISDDLIAIQQLKGLYVSFKWDKKIFKIGVFSPVLKPIEKQICEEIIGRYRLEKKIKDNEVFSSIIYGGGLRKKTYDSTNTVIVRFFNLRIGEVYVDWDKFEEICAERNLPMISVAYYGKYIPKIKNYIVRPSKSFTVKSINLIKRLRWHESSFKR